MPEKYKIVARFPKGATEDLVMMRPGSVRVARLALAAFSIVLGLGLATAGTAATIHSTPLGGNWFLGSTWVGGVTPAPGDHVVLDGPVALTASTNCASLVVSSPGSLRSGTTTPVTLLVVGSVVNSGTIEDGPQNRLLRLDVGADLSNFKIWTNSDTRFIGALDHHLIQGNSAIFEGHLSRDVAASGDVYVDSPFEILGNFLFPGGVLELGSGCPVTLRGGILDGNVVANGNEVRFQSWSYIQGDSFHDVVLAGPATTLDCTFTGTLTVLNSLSNVESLGNAHIFVQGDLVNHGLIHNADYGFTIDLSGDLECTGTMTNSLVSMSGSEPHHLRMGPAGNIDASLLMPEFAPSTLAVDTDARISSSVMLSPNGTMVLAPGITLSLTDGTIDGGSLLTQGSLIDMQGPGYLRIGSADGLRLQGTTQTAGSMSVAGNVRVLGTLQSWPFDTSVITVNGDFYNLGTTRDTAQPLTLRLRGNASNSGAWENQRVSVEGAVDQLVEFGGSIDVPQFVLVAGFTSSSYQWTKDGLAMLGETGPELEFATVSAANAGSYRCHGGGGELSRAITLSATAAGLPDAFGRDAAQLLVANPIRGGVGSTTVELRLPVAGSGNVSVYDLNGRVVAPLAAGAFPAGTRELRWPVAELNSGIYFVRAAVGDRVLQRKVVVVR